MLPSPTSLASRATLREPTTPGEPTNTMHNHEALTSGVSWGAIVGGSFAISALSLLLLALGSGFGLSVVSPWTSRFSSAELGSAAVAWLILSEILASCVGGYLTGRLRTKWAITHSDEVYFRDTANGFLAWAVALVVTSTLLASAAASMVAHSPVLATSGLDTQSSEQSAYPDYFTDVLFRSASNSPRDVAAQAEAARIMAVALSSDRLAPADQAYLSELVASRTGLTPAQADKRVFDTFVQAREGIEAMRKSAAHLLLWVFLGLAMGAFSASYAATIGGRQRDHVRTV
jgi:hypothetical protein